MTAVVDVGMPNNASIEIVIENIAVVLDAEVTVINNPAEHDDVRTGLMLQSDLAGVAATFL